MIEHTFASRELAAAAVASRIENALERELSARAAAAFVVSGGSTPAATLAQLAQKDLEWDRVQVVLSDERWVPPQHADSNERMLRDLLITSRASCLDLLPLYAAGTSMEDRCEFVEETIRKLPLPFACTLLGMGEDGHFASLFPGMRNLADGIDADSAHLCIPVRATGNAHDRISLTLAALTNSREILLLAYGERKHAVIAAAAAGKSDLPIAHLFTQARAPLEIFWAP